MDEGDAAWFAGGAATISILAVAMAKFRAAGGPGTNIQQVKAVSYVGNGRGNSNVVKLGFKASYFTIFGLPTTAGHNAMAHCILFSSKDGTTVAGMTEDSTAFQALYLTGGSPAYVDSTGIDVGRLDADQGLAVFFNDSGITYVLYATEFAPPVSIPP